MSGKVRIGFVGVGMMGQLAHLRNYAALPECEVVALAEVRQELAQKVAARYGVPRVYSTHVEMLKNEKLGALVASQQFTYHSTLIPDLLNANVPIFTEKPLASTIDGGEKILRALEKHKTFVMLGYHKRSDPATAYAKKEIEALKQSGELGKLKYVRLLMPAGEWTANAMPELIKGDGPRPKLPSDPTPRDMDEQLFKDYIAFVNYYIHQVNLLRFLLGEPYSVKYADPSGVLLAGQSQSGVACTIEMSPYQTSIDWQESALIAFEHGWIKLRLPAPLAHTRPGEVEIYKDVNGRAQRTVPQLPWVHAMRQQAANFLLAVKGEQPPLTTAAEALEDLKVAREYLRLWRGK